MSCYTSFHLSWSKECNGATDDAISIMWCQFQWHHMTNSHVAPHFKCLDLRNIMLLLVMQLMSHDTDDGTIGVIWPKKVMLHLNFDNLDLRNAILWLMMLSAAHDSDTSINSIRWPKKSCCISFWLSQPRKWMVWLRMPFGIRWHWCKWHQMNKKKSHCTSFWFSWSKKCKSSIYYAVGLMWYWSQWYHILKRDIFILSVVFT